MSSNISTLPADLQARRLLTRTQAAEYLGIAVGTLANRAWRGEPPHALYVGSSPRYRVSDLDEFTAAGQQVAA